MEIESHLQYIFNHVFLPPKLPQKDDSNSNDENALIREVISALEVFRDSANPGAVERIALCIRMLRSTLDLQDTITDLDGKGLQTKLQMMEISDTIALHIRAQNAGMLIERRHSAYMIETFELSANSKAVMGCKGRLQRFFPGPAIQVAEGRMLDPSFSAELCSTLGNLYRNTPAEAMPTSFKSGKEVYEPRDTIHPMFVTEMLSGILRAVGDIAEVQRFQKNTRDDVLWDHDYLPWRRSANWLLIRVALQATLLEGVQIVNQHHNYKAFMIFFMSRILVKSTSHRLASETLFTMSAKIVRRLMKLDPSANEAWLLQVREALRNAHAKSTNRWKILQADSGSAVLHDTLNLDAKALFKWTHLSLHNLQPYLSQLTEVEPVLPNLTRFIPDSLPRHSQVPSDLPLGQSKDYNADHRCNIWLADIELWVEQNLQRWRFRLPASEQSCAQLNDLIYAYMEKATTEYSGNPRGFSTMILTLIELWIVLDTITCELHPLLRSYSLAFPQDIFEPLLLPFRDQLERIAAVESYLNERCKQATFGSSGMLEHACRSDSFAVQFFNSSVKHQTLRLTIEEHARDRRQNLVQELAQEKDKHRQLTTQVSSMSCTLVTIKTFDKDGKEEYESVHSFSCERCALRREAENMHIGVHEWPLPSAEPAAKAVVFETDVPEAISIWRDVTYTLLSEVFQVDERSQGTVGQDKTWGMKDVVDLAPFVETKGKRYELRSTPKPWTVTHYNGVQTAIATENAVCLTNGMDYESYDSGKNEPIIQILTKYDLRERATFQLPDGPYERLQYAIDNTTHTSNAVIADQVNCPIEIDPLEYYSFGTLRSGHFLQMFNLAREIAVSRLNFSRDETYLLILNTLWQLGPSVGSSSLRDSHIDLKELQLGKDLLGAVKDAFEHVRGNWQNTAALRSFSAIALRLLSLTDHQEIQDRCLDLLSVVRDVGSEWICTISRLIHGSDDEKQREELNLHLLEIALACHGTFDMDKRFAPRTLIIDQNITSLVEYAIHIQDRCPPDCSGLNACMKRLVGSSHRLFLSLEPLLRSRILKSAIGIDMAVQRLWQGYLPGNSWNACPNDQNHWIWTTTQGNDGNTERMVHFNCLNGRLLVDGVPLTRLPKAYEQHRTYARLLGKESTMLHVVVDVIPSVMKGMRFEARENKFGCRIYFTMRNTELIIRVKEDDYVHWRNVANNEIEWRPLRTPWNSEACTWRMMREDESYVLAYKQRVLIDIRSEGAQIIQSLLQPIERLKHVHVFFNREMQTMQLHLPRYKLEFELTMGPARLQSRQFRGMFIDQNQALGTLTGLRSKLVLRNESGSMRKLIIPDGTVSYSRDGNHVVVIVDDSDARHKTYQTYNVDRRLRRLRGTGTLRSKLFQYYLHALTSHCLKDDFTGKTGAEESLDGLASASSLSFTTLEDEELRILDKIARLSPSRKWYPVHLQVMQEVHWNSLPMLSHHNDYSVMVDRIFEHARSMQIFHPGSRLPTTSSYRGNRNLSQRAAIREASVRGSGYGAESHTTDYDSAYKPRDIINQSQRETRTYGMALLVDKWSVNLNPCQQWLEEIEKWGGQLVPARSTVGSPLGYDPEWLKRPGLIFPTAICSILQQLSRSSHMNDKYKLMFFFSALAYAHDASLALCHTLLGFATVPALRSTQLPNPHGLSLMNGYKPTQVVIARLIAAHPKHFNATPASDLPQMARENKKAASRRRSAIYDKNVQSRTAALAQHFLSQWPSANIRASSNCEAYICAHEARNSVQQMFDSWSANIVFKEYVKDVQNTLNSLQPVISPSSAHCLTIPAFGTYSRTAFIAFSDLTRKLPPWVQKQSTETLLNLKRRQVQKDTGALGHLENLLVDLKHHNESLRMRQYVGDLYDSFHALQARLGAGAVAASPVSRDDIIQFSAKAEAYLTSVYQSIVECLCSETSPRRQMAIMIDMIPRLSPHSLLRRLSSKNKIPLLTGWKLCLVEFGLAVSMAQRASRLLDRLDKPTEIIAELENMSHSSWTPIQCPDWLLFEIENDLLIRPVQAKIANEMMKPSSGKNSILQLNMGEGKSSVITPLIAANLADKTRLVRVVVLKQLSKQMFHLLSDRVGGLLNRTVYQLPFSRALQLDSTQAVTIRKIYTECLESQGILLVQPEHLLSFELMGLDQIMSGRIELGNTLLDIQRWLNEHARDILDESDEILSVRFELIYTVGVQRGVEFGPDRWEIVLKTLEEIRQYMMNHKDNVELGLELHNQAPGCFPRVRFTNEVTGKMVLEEVVRAIHRKGFRNLPPSNHGAADLTPLIDSLTRRNSELPSGQVYSDPSVKNTVLTLRGLFAHGVLLFALHSKRWRVNYGLDPGRTVLAVPYRAKDSPASRAEFSHPDVAIVLTALSYYYGGLTDDQLIAAFELLQKSDNSQDEYTVWVRDAPTLPFEHRTLHGVNLRDRGQCMVHVFPHLRFAKGTIDFYLNRLVFPQGMKEFLHKLSSSGWNLAGKKTFPTTGFSGTNDSRYVLPLSIEQTDLEEQRHTNASVMHNLLHTDNTFLPIRGQKIGEAVGAVNLLETVLSIDPPVRVIIDVGAQVLEWNNKEMARQWLLRVSENGVQAAVYFDDSDELVVVDREGAIELLVTSPFTKMMDKCVVYLDEVHTRGTDLKLPPRFRAAVTLAVGVTKDRLVQGCMRMRKLGYGQSVVLLGSNEVSEQIVALRSSKEPIEITVGDVLKWSVLETCTYTKRAVPLWMTQGLRFLQQDIARERLNGNAMIDSETIADSFCEPDAQPLAQRYCEERDQDEQLSRTFSSSLFVTRQYEADAIRAKCEEFEGTLFGPATLQEEQERELCPEVEAERQVERPPVVKPCQHSLHPDLPSSFRTGVIKVQSPAFRPAFSLFRKTTASRMLKIIGWPGDLLASNDFMATIISHGEQELDQFLRPVHWIACFREEMPVKLVLLSPYEANEMMKIRGQWKSTSLHIYSTRTSSFMTSLENLTYCSTPTTKPIAQQIQPLMRQVNLFAGQIFLKDHEEYIQLCRFLALAYASSSQARAGIDGFIHPEDRPGFDMQMAKESVFKLSPIPFLRLIMSMRRNGQSCDKSHIGSILNGEGLTPRDFE
ncbi:hypothetical protein MMC25_004071 [Agyrium rufum]|nr:hypothetical protein [Agyrium rufum]